MPRPMIRRTFASLLVLGALVASPTGVSPLLAQDVYEEVVFRVTLEGPVPPAHTFAVRRGCEEQTCVTEEIVIVCSPPHEFYDYEICAATTYEFTSMIAAGQTLQYSLLRWTTPDLSHTDDQPDEYLHGSWTVREGRQVISLGYDYPAPGDGNTGGDALPDTAMPAP